VLCYAVFVALTAWMGAAALLTGRLGRDHALDHRLPFHSPAFSACALLLVTGVPAVVVAWQSWHGRDRVRRTAMIAGMLLAGWIPVEVIVTRQVGWRPVLYICMGAVFFAIGQDVSHSASHTAAVKRLGGPHT
jgi:hypothetical protein